MAEGSGEQSRRDGAGQASRRPVSAHSDPVAAATSTATDAPAPAAAPALRAGAAGGTGAGSAGRPLQANRRVAAQRRRPDRGRHLHLSLLPRVMLMLMVVLMLLLPGLGVVGVLLSALGGGRPSGLHLADVLAQQREQGLLGPLELVLEGEGLDGEGGGTLVLAVAHHCGGHAVRGRGQASCSGEQERRALH